MKRSIVALILLFFTVINICAGGGEPLYLKLVRKRGGPRYIYNRENMIVGEVDTGLVWHRLVKERYRYLALSPDGELGKWSEPTEIVVKFNSTLFDYSDFPVTFTALSDRISEGRLYSFNDSRLSFTGVIQTMTFTDADRIDPDSLRLVSFNDFGDRKSLPYKLAAKVGGLLVINEEGYIERINSLRKNRLNIYGPGYSYSYRYDESAQNFMGKPQLRQIVRLEGQGEDSSGDNNSFRSESFVFTKGSSEIDGVEGERVAARLKEFYGGRVIITGYSTDLFKERGYNRAHRVHEYLLESGAIAPGMTRVKSKNVPLYGVVRLKQLQRLSEKRLQKFFLQLERRYSGRGMTIVEYSRGGLNRESYKLLKRLSGYLDRDRSLYFRQVPGTGEEERIELYLEPQLGLEGLFFAKGSSILAKDEQAKLKLMINAIGDYLKKHPDSRIIISGGDRGGEDENLALKRRKLIARALSSLERAEVSLLSGKERSYSSLFRGGREDGVVTVTILPADERLEKVIVRVEEPAPSNSKGAVEALFNVTYDSARRISRIRRELSQEKGYYNEWYFVYHDDMVFYINRWDYGKERFEAYCHKFNEQGYLTHYYRFRKGELELLEGIDFTDSARLERALLETTGELREQLPRFFTPLYYYRRAVPGNLDKLMRSELMVLDDELFSEYYLDIITWFRYKRRRGGAR